MKHCFACAGAEQFVDSALKGGALVAVLCNTSGFGATSGLSEAAVAALGPQAERVRVLSSGGSTASSFEGGLEAAKAQVCPQATIRSMHCSAFRSYSNEVGSAGAEGGAEAEICRLSLGILQDCLSLALMLDSRYERRRHAGSLQAIKADISMTVTRQYFRCSIGSLSIRTPLPLTRPPLHRQADRDSLRH